MKILLGLLGVLALAVFGYWFNMTQFSNPRVADELVDNPTGERAARVMWLTYDGRSIPVNYLREGNKVFAGADGPWWRAFRGNGASVTVLVKGESLSGHATVVLDDQDYVKDVFSRLRPNAPECLPDWANGKLVVISLPDSDE